MTTRVNLSGIDGNTGTLAESLTINAISHSTDISITSNSHVGLFIESANGNVGIGTSSPSFDLQLNKSSAPTFRIEETTNNVRLDLRSNSDHTLIRTTSNHDMRFNTNQVDRMTIKNDGNVGIGTASPSNKLDVSGGITASGTIGSGGNLYLGDGYQITTQTSAGKFYAYAGGTYRGGQIDFLGGLASPDAGALIFRAGTGGSSTAQPERMRIDSDGNLLVGTTDNQLFDNTSGSGLCYRPSLSLDIARESTSSTSTAILLNNTGVDSRYITFRKDGTDVGSIGVRSGDSTYIESTASSRTGLDFSGGILPRYNGALSNGSTSLGAASYRFSDLYLSGTAHVGNLQTSSVGRIFSGDGGNETNPMIANGSDQNTGIFFPSADNMAFTSGGVQRAIMYDTGRIDLGGNSWGASIPTHPGSNSSTQHNVRAGMVRQNGVMYLGFQTYFPDGVSNLAIRLYIPRTSLWVSGEIIIGSSYSNAPAQGFRRYLFTHNRNTTSDYGTTNTNTHNLSNTSSHFEFHSSAYDTSESAHYFEFRHIQSSGNAIRVQMRFFGNAMDDMNSASPYVRHTTY